MWKLNISPQAHVECYVCTGIRINTNISTAVHLFKPQGHHGSGDIKIRKMYGNKFRTQPIWPSGKALGW